MCATDSGQDPVLQSPPAEAAGLMRAAQTGDPEARSRLFALHYECARQTARRRMGLSLRRHFDTDDIVQRALIVAVRKLDECEFDDGAKFCRWLRRCVARQVTDAADWHNSKMRCAEREVSLEVAQRDGRIRLPPCPQPPPPELAASREQYETVLACIALLRPLYRDVIRLRAVEGHDWSWIALQLQRSGPNAARMLYKTARDRLAALVRSHPERRRSAAWGRVLVQGLGRDPGPTPRLPIALSRVSGRSAS